MVSWLHKNVPFSKSNPTIFAPLPYTVIRNGNFSAKTLFGDTMLGNTYAAYYWTSKTTRISEKIKKAKEGHKGQSKGQTHTKIKFSNFFDIVGFI